MLFSSPFECEYVDCADHCGRVQELAADTTTPAVRFVMIQNHTMSWLRSRPGAACLLDPESIRDEKVSY